MARRIEFEVVVDADGAVTALRQVADTAEETGEEVEEMGEKGGKASRNLKASLSGVKGAFAAVAKSAAAAAAAVTAVGVAVVRMAASNDEVAKLATTLGTTAEELQLVTGALELGGVGADMAAQAIRDLNLRLADAALNGGASAEALNRLGISAQQLESLPLPERFALIADRLQTLESQSLKARTAADLMGEAGVRLLSAFEGGGEGIRQAADAIERAGIVSNETAAASESFTDSITLLSRSLGSLARDFLEPLMPPMQRLADEFTELIQLTRQYIQARDDMDDRGRLGQRVDVYSDALRGAEEQLAALLASAAEAQANQDFAGMERLTLQMQAVEEEIIKFRELQDAAKGGMRELANQTEEAGSAIDEQTGSLSDNTAALQENLEAVQNLNEAESFASELQRERVAIDQDLVISGIEAVAAARDDVARRRREQAEEEIRMEEERSQTILGSALNIISMIQRAEQDAMNQRIREEEAASRRVQSIRDQLADATTERSSERLRNELEIALQSERIANEEARQAFARSKALALGQAVISTAQAVASALAIPPAPNIPLGIAAGALGGAQIAAIAAEPAPSFHSGGLLRDEMMIRARQGEAVLSPAAVRAAGGEEGVRALNQGQAMGPTTLVVQQKIRTRVLDAQVYDLGRSGRGSLQNQIHRGRPRPGSHRPTGMG